MIKTNVSLLMISFIIKGELFFYFFHYLRFTFLSEYNTKQYKSEILNLFTFTSYCGEIFQSFSTDIAEFTFKPGYIRPDMAHGILKKKFDFQLKNKILLWIYFYKYRCNAWAWRYDIFSTTIMTNKIAY